MRGHKCFTLLNPQLNPHLVPRTSLHAHRPGAPAAKLRTNPFNLPGDVATELRDLRSVEHPNIKLVQKTKVDWRGCVAGTWRKVATKGPCPLPLHSASVTYYNGKVGCVMFVQMQV